MARHVLLPALLTAAVIVIVEERRKAIRGVPAAAPESVRTESTRPVEAVPSVPREPRLEVHQRVAAEAKLPSDSALARSTRDHLAPPLLSPPERIVFWQAGKLDGEPRDIFSPLAAHEFRVLSSDAPVIVIPRGVGRGPTTQGQSPANAGFPQTLMPGQKIVVHLPEFERQDALVCARIAASGREADWFSLTSPRPWLEALVNGTQIWNRILPLHAFPLTALAPAAALEDYDNTLVLINRGKFPVCFDAVWVEAAAGRRPVLACSVADWDELPPYARRFLPRSAQPAAGQGPAGPPQRLLRADQRLPLVPIKAMDKGLLNEDGPLWTSIRFEWAYSACPVGFEYQEETSERFLESTLGFFFHGGTDLVLSGLTDVEGMFCPRTGRPYPCACAWREFGQLFLGGSRLWLPVNVLPAGDSEPPMDRVYWLGTIHGKDKATILIARGCGGRPPERVRVVAALPWTGETDMAAAAGVFPESLGMRVPTNRASPDAMPGSDDYDRDRIRTSKRAKLRENSAGAGLLDEVFEIKDSLSLELTRTGAVVPERQAPAPASFTSRLRTPEGSRTPRIMTEREGPRSWLHLLAPAPALFRSVCSNYKVSRAKATRADIAGARHVVPLAAESLCLEISYPAGCPKGAEGMALDLAYFNQPSIAGTSLNVWVLPHVTSQSVKDVTIGGMVGNETVELVAKTGLWQRIVWPLPEFGRDERPYLVVYADRQWPEFRDGGKVVLEFNGCSLVRDPGATGVRTRWAEDRGRFEIAMRGAPGQEALFRTFFPDPVGVRRVGTLKGPSSEPHWRYDAEAQMLEVSGLRFPDGETPRAEETPGREPESGNDRSTLTLYVELER
ncbi:MAG: hypothetical protein A3K19_04570 [Lentisphaerae bacterium RIFOXYB12_FULL_65_16]|nr:MAG: hypothetical protein A3K18_01380 [Lentisphaerae bacterium RIFOXYA12_64_32]OGV84593.1 MAG: hypothetical protein A3K19_04570 [Lentisphaerae bacterium RIFOXYB12_FULL_65_16]